MTRGTMRSILRRRINDVSDNNPFFSDNELNEALDLGAAKIEKAILSIDPTATIKITRQNIEAGENLYPKPQGAWSVLDVKLLDESTGVYTTLGDPISIEDAEKLDVDGNTTTRYAHLGRWIQLSPTPSAAITSGLEWRTVFGTEIPTGTDFDNEVYPYPTALHNAIVLWAQVLLQPEFEEGSNTAELRAQIQEELADLPMYYRRSAGREVPLQPDVRKVGAGGFNRRDAGWRDGQAR